MSESQEHPKQKLTAEGLPVVTADNLVALGSLSILCGDANAERYLEEFGERLKRENPEIERLIDGMHRDGGFSDEYMNGFIYGALLVYESMRRQLAASKLEQQANGESAE